MVGNLSNFMKIDILRCFLRINKETSRADLKNELELGEGTIRTILNILKNKELIESTRKGHFLNNKGNNFLKKINQNIEIKKIKSNKIYPEFKKVGILVKSLNKDLKIDYKLRDIAVKHGSEGAIIFHYVDKLIIPNSDYEKSFSDLENLFNFKKNNILIVTFATTDKLAEYGALAVAIELNEDLRKFMNLF
jgi:predicted transcriptional regulator